MGSSLIKLAHNEVEPGTNFCKAIFGFKRKVILCRITYQKPTMLAGGQNIWDGLKHDHPKSLFFPFLGCLLNGLKIFLQERKEKLSN